MNFPLRFWTTVDKSQEFLHRALMELQNKSRLFHTKYDGEQNWSDLSLEGI